MNLRKDEVLRGVKLLSGLKSTENDEKLMYLIELIIEQVKSYINYSEEMQLPSALEKTIAAITSHVLTINDFGIAELKKDIQEKAITRGDTKIEFNVASALPSIAEVEGLGPYLRVLKRYKRTQMR
ncbi:head-tail connector protein [Filifactor villosus]|uniref:Head-tail connector protein n=1 Tax=Filifactor villosus TaxID=29374 RepID=A0ABV9QMM0_9FIRM